MKLVFIDYLNSIDLDRTASAFAICISLVALLFSFLNYKLRRQDRKSHMPALEVYYETGTRFSSEEEQYDNANYCWSFRIMITNTSRSHNSILGAQLKISYIGYSGDEGELVLDNVNSRTDDFNTPVSLTPMESVSGWFTFSTTVNIYNDLKNLTYEIEIMDAAKLGKKVEPIVILPMRLKNDEKKS
ncbi:hypothetical protein [Robiginitomaculum antarcticum]|uniref:hypothetical protein n=1 Tax=Robiginitomaculum antarcticum TaxID=437507 RepID=UPI0012EA49F9|nr:hypothetical protein [Robiginitomaculum antarcticum]